MVFETGTLKRLKGKILFDPVFGFFGREKAFFQNGVFDRGQDFFEPRPWAVAHFYQIVPGKNGFGPGFLFLEFRVFFL
jgi:hypothetical protein